MADNKQKQTLNDMMREGKTTLVRTGSPTLAHQAAVRQNNLPPTMWGNEIKSAMMVEMWYAISVRILEGR